MKLTCHAMKGLIAAAAILLLFTAAPANAGTVTLTGLVDTDTELDGTHHLNSVSQVHEGTTVSLELNWMDDSLVKPEGESKVMFWTNLGNTMLLKIGSNISIDSNPKYGSSYPTATFTDGILTDFTMAYYLATLDGVGGEGTWAVYIQKLNASDTYLTLSVFQENTAPVDWFQGHINLPVPLPASAMLFGSGIACLLGLRRKKLG